MKTPYLIFDERVYHHNLNILKSVSDNTGCKFLLSLKAYIPYHSASLTNEYFDGVSCSSLNEYRIAEEYFNLKNHFYCPAFSETDLIETCSEVVVFNSIQQYKEFYHLVPNKTHKHLRINVEYKTETSYNPNLPYSRLGITNAELDRSVLGGINGILIHSLCDQGSEELSEVVDILENNFSDVLHQIKYLNLGGGHAITHPNYNIDKLEKLLNYISNKYNVQVILEPSEYVFYGVGKMKTKVLSVFKNDKNIAILDSSVYNHMPTILEHDKFEWSIEEGKPNEELEHVYILGGPSCLSNDVFGSASFNSPLKVGDVITLTNQAPYASTRSNWFNGVRKPGLQVINLNGEVKMSKDDTYELYLKSITQ